MAIISKGQSSPHCLQEDILLIISMQLLFAGIHEQMMRNTASKIALISWMFTCIVYSVTYSSNLVAFLTVDVVKPPFDSLETLSSHHQFKFGMIGQGFMTSLFKVRYRGKSIRSQLVVTSCYNNKGAT